MNVALMTVTHNELSSRLPRLLYSIDKFFPKTPGRHKIMHYIWDNNSSDGTSEWLESLDRSQRVICSRKNLFDLPAYNKLVKMAAQDGRDVLMALNPNTRILQSVDLDDLVRPFTEDKGLAILGRPGPRVLKEDAEPHGVEGWGWVARLLTERDFWEEEDINTAHVQTWCFLTRISHFLAIGGFKFRNRRFDMNNPEARFPGKPLDYGDKGVMISAEIEFSVRAKRLGYTAGYMQPWPFYHYFCHGDACSTVGKLDEQDARHGIEPLSYVYGDLGEDKFG